jgi:hypothetical protein
MRDHSECEDVMNNLLAKGKEGEAEYAATRCDMNHARELMRAAKHTDTEEDA